MSVRYKMVTDTPEGYHAFARETDDSMGIVWEEWNSTDRCWQRSEWACDAFNGFGEYAVDNVRELPEAEALPVIEARSGKNL